MTEVRRPSTTTQPEAATRIASARTAQDIHPNVTVSESTYSTQDRWAPVRALSSQQRDQQMGGHKVATQIVNEVKKIIDQSYPDLKGVKDPSGTRLTISLRNDQVDATDPFTKSLRLLDHKYEAAVVFDPLLQLEGKGGEARAEVNEIELGLNALSGVLDGTAEGYSDFYHELRHFTRFKKVLDGKLDSEAHSRMSVRSNGEPFDIVPSLYQQSFFLDEAHAFRISGDTLLMEAKAADADHGRELYGKASKSFNAGKSFAYKSIDVLDSALKQMEARNAGRMIEVLSLDDGTTVAYVDAYEEGFNRPVEIKVPIDAKFASQTRGRVQAVRNALTDARDRMVAEAVDLDIKSRLATQFSSQENISQEDYRLTFDVAKKARGSDVLNRLAAASANKGAFEGIEATELNVRRLVSEIIGDRNDIQIGRDTAKIREYFNGSTGRGIVVDKATSEIMAFLSKDQKAQGAVNIKDGLQLYQKGRTAYLRQTLGWTPGQSPVSMAPVESRDRDRQLARTRAALESFISVESSATSGIADMPGSSTLRSASADGHRGCRCRGETQLQRHSILRRCPERTSDDLNFNG